MLCLTTTFTLLNSGQHMKQVHWWSFIFLKSHWFLRWTSNELLSSCSKPSVMYHFCIDNRKGSCWTRLVGGRCENNIPRLTLKSECCCSIGLAWGSPCEICHGLCDCPKGYAKVSRNTCCGLFDFWEKIQLFWCVSSNAGHRDIKLSTYQCAGMFWNKPV